MKPIIPSAEFLRRMLEHAHDSIHIVDDQGVSVFDSAGEVLGFPLSEVIGRTNVHLLHREDKDRAVAALALTFETGLGGPVEYRIRHRDGSWLSYESVGTRYVDEEGRVFAIINTRQITEQLRVRAEVRQLEAQLQQSQKLEEIGRLAGGIAHDFNNLLAAILGYAEELQDRLVDDPAGLAELAEIQRAGQRAAQLTRQLLAFSRKQLLNPQVVIINDGISEMVQMLQPMLGPDIALVTHLMQDLPPVRVDPGQLQQVLMNLAVNAHDAMPAGGVIRISTRTTWLAEKTVGSFPAAPGRYVQLTFADTGCGIPPEMLPFIFEPFFTTKPEGQGTGLGLAMIYGILKQSDGEIAVESEPGNGTAFHVYLPAVGESPIPDP